MRALYYDLQQGCLVHSLSSNTPYLLSPWFAGATEPVTVYALTPTGNPVAPYTIQLIQSLSLSLTYSVNNGRVPLASTGTFFGGGDGSLVGTLTLTADIAVPTNLEAVEAVLAADITVASGPRHIESRSTLKNPAFAITPPEGQSTPYPPAADVQAAVDASATAPYTYADYAKMAAAAVDGAIADETASSTTYSLYSAGDFTTGTGFVRNPALWLNVDLTCLSPWNSLGHNQRAGTLITPKHALCANHFPLTTGTAVVFVGSDGSRNVRTVATAPQQVGSTDLLVVTLDSDLPATVRPTRCLPPSVSDSFLSVGAPVAYATQAKELHIAEVANFSGNVIASATTPNRLPWTTPGPGVDGDSGSPIFIVLDGEAVLWSLFYHANDTGYQVQQHLAEINALLGPGYALAYKPLNLLPSGPPSNSDLAANNTWTGTNTFESDVAVQGNLPVGGQLVNAQDDSIWAIYQDGSGKLANENIQWDAQGNLGTRTTSLNDLGSLPGAVVNGQFLRVGANAYFGSGGAWKKLNDQAGAAQVTGLRKGNGANPDTAAAATDITALLDTLPTTNPNDGTWWLSNGVPTKSGNQDPLTASWLSHVASAGGTVTSSQTNAVNAFAISLRAANLLPLLKWLNPRTGDYAASKVPLIGSTNEVHTGFVAADYSPTGGLTGNGSNKWLDTGLVPSVAGLSPGGASMFAALKTAVADANANLFADYSADGNTVSLTAWPNYAGGVRGSFFGQAYGSTGGQNTPGVLVWSQASATDRRIYAAGVQVGSTDTTNVNAAATSNNIQMFRAAAYGGINYLAATVGAAGIGLGLTSSDAANLTSAINQLEAALGR